ncbi:hypothetical protein ACFL6S_12030 [Candidatus Poribacteria bacterium]
MSGNIECDYAGRLLEHQGKKSTVTEVIVEGVVCVLKKYMVAGYKGGPLGYFTPEWVTEKFLKMEKMASG